MNSVVMVLCFVTFVSELYLSWVVMFTLRGGGGERG